MSLTIVGFHPYPLPVLVPKYIDAIPKIALPYPAFKNTFERSRESDGCFDGLALGQWGSNYTWGSPLFPGPWNYSVRDFMVAGDTIRGNSDHLDSSGRGWSTF